MQCRILQYVVLSAAAILAVGLSACGGGSGDGPPSLATAHSVTVTWQPNRDSGVNRAGGGYEVSITGQPAIIVPYASGPATPTFTTVSLTSGTYMVTVRAFAALDPQGGNSGRLSTPSQPLAVNVP